MNGFTHSLQMPASIYTNLNSLAALRTEATSTNKAQKAKATEAVAKQLESIFLQMMLKSMRKASPVGKSGETDQMRFYQDMFDKQIALDLANRKNGGIGLAKIIQQQLSGTTTAKKNTVAGIAALPVNRLHHQHLKMLKSLPSRSGATSPVPGQMIPGQAASVQTAAESFRPQTPQQFIRVLWKHAQRSAAKLGVKPEVLIAQSALETGWGQRMITDSNGRNANNLFGIKVNTNWPGRQVTVRTLEYHDGVASKESARFRAYSSIAESFDDYVRLLQSSPRYQQALRHAGNDREYLQQLQQAGYATDPAYAEKISAITRRSSFVQAIQAIKNNQLAVNNYQQRPIRQTGGINNG